jgi:hypothetical protein
MDRIMIPETAKEIIEVRRVSISACGATKLYLPLQDNHRVFVKDDDYLGGLSMAISHHVLSVVCLCEKQEDAERIKKRINSEKISNIQVIIGTLDTIPFNPNSFDMVCIHGLLLPSDEVPFKLKSIDSILIEGGMFYFSFYKNPEMLKSKFKLWPLKARVEKYIKDNGFEKKGTLQHYESFSNLYFVRIFKPSMFKNLRIFYKYCKSKLNDDNCGFIFQKKGASFRTQQTNLLISRIKTDIEAKIRIKLKAEELIRIGSNDSLVVDFGPVIVRLPQTDTAENFCYNNFETLKILARETIPVQIPIPLANGEVDKQRYFVESKLVGVSLDTSRCLTKQVPSIIQQAYNFLINPCLLLGSIDASDFERLVNIPFAVIGERLTSSDSLILGEVYKKIKAIIFVISLPKVICHGDFKFSNFICSRNPEPMLLGIIDWECSSVPGLPLYDLFTMLVWSKRCDQNDSEYRVAQRIWNLVSSADIDPMLLCYMEALHIDSRLLKPLSILSMIVYLNNNFYPEVRNGESWYQEMVTGCLIPACEQFLVETEPVVS